MRNPIIWIAALLIVGTACAGPAMAEKATKKKHSSETLALLHAPTFGDGGMFTGPVGPTMALNGQLYQVALGGRSVQADGHHPDTLVFESLYNIRV